MRQLMWIAILAAFSQSIPIAFAQSDSGTKGGTYSVGPNGVPHPGFIAEPRNPTNCGTPDDLKSCGPMPRRALQTFPGR
jgi:hypothetical protein